MPLTTEMLCCVAQMGHESFGLIIVETDGVVVVRALPIDLQEVPGKFLGEVSSNWYMSASGPGRTRLDFRRNWIHQVFNTFHLSAWIREILILS